MTGSQKAKEDQEIKKLIVKTANEFDINCKDSDALLVLTKGDKKLEMFYNRCEFDENDNRIYQGLCSKNGGNKERYYNLRVCIVDFFCVGGDLVG